MKPVTTPAHFAFLRSCRDGRSNPAKGPGELGAAMRLATIGLIRYERASDGFVITPRGLRHVEEVEAASA